MRHIRFSFLKYAIMAFGLLLLSSCREDDPDTLLVSPTEFTFAADDTKKEIAVVATNVDTWSFQKSDSWVTANQESDKLYISVVNNETGNPRETTISVIAGKANPVTITVKQSARNKLSISPEALLFDAGESGSKVVTVDTDAPGWDAKTDGSWIKLDKQGNTLNVSAEANPGSNRNAKITITAGNAAEKTITVTQAERNTLFISPSSLLFASDETGEQPVTITTNAPDWEATTEADWITFSKQGNTLLVSVSENTGLSDRDATITIAAGSAPPATLPVKQQKQNNTLSINPLSLSFTASADEQSVTVTTNASGWEATANASWITVSKQSNTLLVSVSANTATSSRTANITITAGNAPAVTLTVTQNGANNTLSVSPSSLSFGASESAQKTVTVTTNASGWEATANASWITLSKQSNTLLVSVSANTATSSRTADITITAGNASSRTVTVTQAARSTGDYVYHGGHSYLIVKTQRTWQAAVTDAQSRGGYLVEIGSAAEQTAVYNAVKAAVSETYTQAPDGGGVAYVWLGGHDSGSEGTWVWNNSNATFWTGGKNGTAHGYANWGAGEPDDFSSSSLSPNGQDYAALALEAWPKGNGSLGSAGQWNDIAGTNQLYYVVEFDEEK
jgi:hypothetical protein